MPTFQSALLKIQRAESQTKYLASEIERIFLDPADPAHIIEMTRDPDDPRRWRAIFRVLKQPPEEWGVLLGEIIHNLRSALDHLVYEATALNNGGKALSRTEYPIYSDQSKYQGKGLDKIRGLNALTRDFVERTQPFTVQDPNVVPYLWLLHDLNIID